MFRVTLLIAIVGLITPGNANTQSLCPDSKGYDVETPTACFRFVLDEVKTYYDARSLCWKSGGQLASITNRQENYVVIKKLQELFIQNKFWIGMNNRKQGDKKRQYLWENGSPVSFDFWAKDEGLYSDTFKCVVLDYTEGNQGRWFDTSCTASQHAYPGYICKYTPKPKTPTTKKATQKPTDPPKTTKTTTATTAALTTPNAATTAALTTPNAATTAALTTPNAATTAALTTPNAATTAALTTPNAATTAALTTPNAATTATLTTPNAATTATLTTPNAATTAALTTPNAATTAALTTPNAATTAALTTPNAATTAALTTPNAVTTAALTTPNAATTAALTTPNAATTAALTTPNAATTEALDSRTTTEPFVDTTTQSASTAAVPEMTTSTASDSTTTLALPAEVTEVDPNLAVMDDDKCVFDCPDLDCGMNGFKSIDFCQICECIGS